MKLLITYGKDLPAVKFDKKVTIRPGEEYKAFDFSIIKDFDQIYTYVESPAYAFATSLLYSKDYFIVRNPYMMPNKIPRVEVKEVKDHLETSKEKTVIIAGQDKTKAVVESYAGRKIDEKEPDMSITKMPKYKGYCIVFTPTTPSIILDTLSVADKYNVEVILVAPVIDSKIGGKITCNLMGKPTDKISAIKFLKLI
ncbi:hypothetical protein [Acidianus ambivalens]|uniref:Uncharacterized protein n=1 Tax=Acidianus ambivalens TaxID=2283 RepID=A0A650CW16_ACIAM|nr:hypothetical protein [Acidianus ambivalens]MQL56413.1 hypothetical protein [Acidianus ambivalens]QGR21968.1 hypothetical protein D1866_08080 [Acidianus ambivalens]